jgi:hypothetical protein
MSDSNVFDGSAWVEFDSEADWMAGKRLHKGSMGETEIPQIPLTLVNFIILIDREFFR